MANKKPQEYLDKIPRPPIEVLEKLQKKDIRVQNPGELPPEMLALVRTWWLERAPYSDIVNTLKKKGYDIYGPTIVNWCRKTWPDSIAESVGEEASPEDVLNLTPERQAIELLWRKSLHSIRQIRTDSKTCIVNLNTMASTVGRIAQAQSLLDKLETDRMKAGGDKVKLLETAKEQLKSEIRKIIGNKPKLVDELCDIFDDAAGNATMMN